MHICGSYDFLRTWGVPPLKNEAPILKTSPPLKREASFHEMIPRKSTINNI